MQRTLNAHTGTFEIGKLLPRALLTVDNRKVCLKYIFSVIGWTKKEILTALIINGQDYEVFAD